MGQLMRSNLSAWGRWLPRARRLSEAEVAAYDLLPEHWARSVIVVEVPVLPGPVSGLTLGRLVFHQGTLHPERPSRLMAHELVHVRQFAEQGFLRFSLEYNAAFARNLTRVKRWGPAYRAIPAEVEARTEALEWSRRLVGPPESIDPGS